MLTDFTITPAQEAQLLKLWAKGQEDHREHLCHMRGDVVLMESIGTEDKAAFPDGYDVESNIHPGDIIMHNHPDVLNSFSNSDLFNGSQFKVDSYVITEDKSMYFARSLVGTDRLILAWALVNALVEPVAERAYNDVGILHAQHGVTHMATNDAHFTNRLLAAADQIDYSYRLAEPTQQMLDKVSAYAEARMEAEGVPKL